MLALLVAPSNVWFLYLSGFVVLCAGLLTIWRDLRDAPLTDKLVLIGPLCFAVPLGIFGAQHFILRDAIMQIMPSWIPWHLFIVLLVGICLIAAALSIATRIQSVKAALLFAVMILCFEAFMHIPNAVADPHDRMGWTIVLREFTFASGGLAIAASHAKAWSIRAKHMAATFTRFGLGIPITFFGIQHLLHPALTPGVPLRLFTPTWIPGHSIWGYVTGIVYVIAGPCLIVNRRARPAALAVGVMLLVLIFAVYLPMLAAAPFDIANAINYLFDTLLVCGSALAVAEIQGGATTSPVATEALHA